MVPLAGGHLDPVVLLVKTLKGFRLEKYCVQIVAAEDEG